MRRAQVRERKVFFDRHARRGAAQRVLKEPPDAAGALVLGHEGDVLARERNAALVGIKAARDGVEERRLACAVRADDGDEVALVQMQGKGRKRLFLIHRAGVEGLGEILNVQHLTCPPYFWRPFCASGTPPTSGCSARRWPAPR